MIFEPSKLSNPFDEENVYQDEELAEPFNYSIRHLDLELRCK